MCQTRHVSALIQDIAANVRTLRELRGLGQLELARRAGVSRRTVARLENAEIADPGVESLQRFAAALGVALETLCGARLALVRLALPAPAAELLASPKGPEALAEIGRFAAHLADIGAGEAAS